MMECSLLRGALVAAGVAAEVAPVTVVPLETDVAVEGAAAGRAPPLLLPAPTLPPSPPTLPLPPAPPVTFFLAMNCCSQAWARDSPSALARPTTDAGSGSKDRLGVTARPA